MICPRCDAEGQPVFSGRFWDVSLHENQCFLGRSVLVPKRHAEGLSELSAEEKQELFALASKLRTGLAAAFRPHGFHYAFGETPHRHLEIHIVPRYQAPTAFLGVTFTDPAWGKHYSHGERDYQIPDELHTAIGNRILRELKKG